MVEARLSTLAQWDNEVRSERTIAGMTTATRHGKWCYKAPVGYLNDPNSPGGLRPDPSRVDLVKKAFELFDGGFTKGEVLLRIRAAGLTMPKSGKLISAQTLDKLLRNPPYCGWITSTGWDIEVRGDFAPIVDEARFRRTSERLSGGPTERQSGSKNSVDFPLRGFLRCAVCGVPMTGSSTTGRKGKRYPSYSCRTTGCETASFGRDVLHRMFVEFLYGLFPKEALMDRFRDIVKSVWQKRHGDRERERDLALERKKKLESRRQRLIDLLVDDALQKPRVRRPNDPGWNRDGGKSNAKFTRPC
jgi:site-specific DNA recombinase